MKKEEIIGNGYDLSINKYKQVEYTAKEYPPTSEIIEELEKRHQRIGEQLRILKEMLDMGE